jgi:adenylate cyclase
MTRWSQIAWVSLLTALLGVIFGLLPWGLALEENLGLDLLFRLRGPRAPPPEVVVISTKNASAAKLGLPEKPEKWPRSLHGQLIDHLAQRGAEVIVFDIIFSEARSTEEDTRFSQAIAQCGKIVLVELIKNTTVAFPGGAGVTGARLNIERLIRPIPLIAESAAALAPFPLPDVPLKVSQYWTFKTSCGETPTLPVVAFQIFAAPVYPDFLILLQEASSGHGQHLPRDMGPVMAEGRVGKLTRDIRAVFEQNRGIGERMLAALESRHLGDDDRARRARLVSLIRMYQAPDSQYLDFYGPAQTVTTIAYAQVLRPEEEGGRSDLRGKAVFVGSSANRQPEQKEEALAWPSVPSALSSPPLPAPFRWPGPARSISPPPSINSRPGVSGSRSWCPSSVRRRWLTLRPSMANMSRPKVNAGRSNRPLPSTCPMTSWNRSPETWPT